MTGTWSLEFVEGGPTLPKATTSKHLQSWTKLAGDQGERFAGTAQYTITFDSPGATSNYLLDLGRVADSARVRLNGKPIATLISRPFHVVIDTLPQGNRLEVEVTNVAANRIRDLDIRGVPWKELNGYGMLNIGEGESRKLDASTWPIRDAGLLGPVTLQPLD